MLIFPSSVNVWVYEILCCSTSKLHLIREQEELILYHSILSDRPVWDIQIKFSPLWLIFCNLLHATNCFRCCSCLLVSADGGSQAGDWVGLTAHRITSLTQGAFINNFYLASMDGFNLGPSCKSNKQQHSTWNFKHFVRNDVSLNESSTLKICFVSVTNSC